MKIETEYLYTCPSCLAIVNQLSKEDSCASCGNRYSPKDSDICPECESEDYILHCPACDGEGMLYLDDIINESISEGHLKLNGGKNA